MKIERDDENPVLRMRLVGTVDDFQELEDALVEGRRTQRQKDLLTKVAIQMREVRTGTPEDERTVSDRFGPKPNDGKKTTSGTQ